MKKSILSTVLFVTLAGAFSMMSACGGGGGGRPVIYYPYETVYGDICQTYQATPGCTFLTSTGQRIQVTEDPDFNKYGYGSDDLKYVKFDNYGNATVYDDLGKFLYYADVSDFAGYVGGTSIGVGTSGYFWEDIRGGTYWIGRNSVLYSANKNEGNYGEAINNQVNFGSTDRNIEALNTQANKELVKLAAQKLTKSYGFKAEKAMAVASSLNAMALSVSDNGVITTKELDKTFEGVFGVPYKEAISAALELKGGDNTEMSELTERIADSNNLEPYQAKQFIKDMYRNAAASWGYNIDQWNW